RVDRDLLADGRLESGVEREQELLDVLPVGRVEILEHGSRDEVEHGGHAAVVQEPEAPHLIADGGAAGDAGHADLLVEVAEVSDLELLRLALEGREAVGAERQPVAERAVIAPRSVFRVRNRFCPVLCAVVATSSSERIGLGGRVTVRMKSVNACISPSVSCVPRPSRLTNAGLKALNAICSSSASRPVVETGRPP